MLAMADDWRPAAWSPRSAGTGPTRRGSAIVQLRLLAGIQRLVLSRAGRSWPATTRTSVAPPRRTAPGRTSSRCCGGTSRSCGRRWSSRRRPTSRAGRCRCWSGSSTRFGAPGWPRSGCWNSGASAGLNLLVDRFRIAGNGWSARAGGLAAAVADAVLGPVTPVQYAVVARRGCDLAPVDAATTGGPAAADLVRLAARPAPARAAARGAGGRRRHPVPVDAAPASSWLAASWLCLVLTAGVLTVVWHSITRQYWPAGRDRGASAGAGRRPGDRMPIAHIAMESPVSATTLARAARSTGRPS